MIETGFRHFNQSDYLSVTVRAPLSGRLVARAIRVLNRYPKYEQGIPLLWDLRESDLSLYTTADMSLTNATLQSYPGRRNAKSASLVASFGAIHLSRLWSIYGIENFPQERKAFLRFEDAMQWIFE